MTLIDENDFLGELKFCLTQPDLVKARALLQFASDGNISARTQQHALLQLAAGPEETVFPLLAFMGNLAISAPGFQESLYKLILDKAYGNVHLLKAGIKEYTGMGQRLFVRAAGELMLTQAAPELEALLHVGTQPHLLREAVTALGRLRLAPSLSALAPMVDHPDPDVQKAALSAIAEIGTRQGLDLLLGFTGGNEVLNKLAIEALADTQEFYALEKLTELLASPITNVRDTAIDQLVKMGPKVTPMLTHAFQNAQADYLIHLITTLGHIKDPAAIHPILSIIQAQPSDPNIRQAAYEAMERIPSPRTAVCLAQGLNDPVEAVRMSAARAIDRNLSQPLVAGLKNMVRRGDAQARNAVGALIDTQADSVFNFIVSEPGFVEAARTHIQTTAAPNVRQQFVRKMEGLGCPELGKELEAQIQPQPVHGQSLIRIVVVDDSKMMLRLYQNKLTAMGYNPVLFLESEKAVADILATPPDLVITDLNMPHISGLELTREVRKKYPRQSLPILMITTQSDVAEEVDASPSETHGTLNRYGIDQVLHKPFTDPDFQTAVQTFIPWPKHPPPRPNDGGSFP